MRVYHRREPPAGRPIRVVWTLEELGLPYEIVVLTPEQQAAGEHRSRHPLGRVPVLEDDDGPLFESSAICLHLVDVHRDAGLIPPSGTHDRALVYQWAFFAMTEIEPPAIEVRRTRESAPEVADAAAERARTAIAAIEAALADREYLVGGDFTVADVIASEVVRIAGRTGAYEPAGRVAEWRQQMESRPARQRAAAALG
jgi:glutathione S-transferase